MVRLRVALLLPLSLASLSALAFSQRTPITAVGHEWLTAAGAKEAVKASPADAAALSGKGKWAGSGCEHGCPGHDYDADNYLVWSAAQGQRWVDIGGFSVTDSGHRTCWDAITQSPDDLQYDHFLRARTDANSAGGLHAMQESVKRFRAYFLAAVALPDGTVDFMDGGATSGVLGGKFKASKPYFLFGRAMHLFQDSFSLEHAVRESGDGFTKLHGIKSYVCSPGSPQHGHSAPGNVSQALKLNPGHPSRAVHALAAWGGDRSDYATNGDVLWKSATGSYGNDNLKPHAKAALEAMKDLWLAFERARAKKVPAAQAVDALIARWMTIAGDGGPATPFDAAKCAKDASLKSEAEVDALRTKCLAITGKNPDDAKKPPYSWTSHAANWPDADVVEKATAAVQKAGDKVEKAADKVGSAASSAADKAKSGAKSVLKKLKP